MLILPTTDGGFSKSHEKLKKQVTDKFCQVHSLDIAWITSNHGNVFMARNVLLMSKTKFALLLCCMLFHYCMFYSWCHLVLLMQKLFNCWFISIFLIIEKFCIYFSVFSPLMFKIRFPFKIVHIFKVPKTVSLNNCIII